ncbi:MAG TPA: hypothetical protein VKU19_03045 [Bryobacteraceae bacterium]|nr:hypothetical protein [Bryobacteraceae bacterium]
MNGIVATVGDAGRRDIFYLDSNFGMKQRMWDGTQWSPDLIGLGGIFTSAPAAVATMVRRAAVIEGGNVVTLGASPGAASQGGVAPETVIARTTAAMRARSGIFPEVQRIDVFGLGLDYAMYHKALLGDPAESLGPWENLGGIFRSAPAVIAIDGQIHIFGLGTDYSMFEQTWNGSAWSGSWDRLGGFFSSAPVVVSWGSGRFDLFARGADFTLRHRSFQNNVATNDWQNLGGSLASPPVAVSWGPNRLDVFAVNNADGGIIHRWWDGMIWNDWEHVAGSAALAFTSAPAAATWGVGRLDVFATGSDGNLYHVSSSEDAWSQPESLGGKIALTPCVQAPAENQLQVIGPGTDGNLYQQQWTGEAWDTPGWQQLGDHTRLPSQYRFSIDLLRVDTPRSLVQDTDSGQCSLAIGNWPTTIPPTNWPLLAKTQSQGDLGGPSIKEGSTNLMNFGPVTVELCESAIFNYTFTNTHDDQASVDSTLSQQGAKLADSGVSTVAKAIGSGLEITSVDVAGVAAPLFGSLLSILSGWLAGQLNSILDGICNGVVAVEQIVIMGADLQMKTIGGQPYTMTTIHAGTDSHVGCGGNSKYEVTWSISAL